MSMSIPSIYDDMSNAEKEVAHFLTVLGLWWSYEQPVYIADEKERPRVWTPDFYLPELGIYIEVCGSETVDYPYRQKMYEENRIPVIFVHFYKKDKWMTFLVKEIEKKQTERLNLVKTMQQKANGIMR